MTAPREPAAPATKGDGRDGTGAEPTLADAALNLADAALAAAVDPFAAGTLSAEGLAERAGVPVALVEAMRREGLLQAGEGPTPFTDDDAEAVRAGLALVEAGVPLAELLELARRSDQALRGIADEAVELFMRFVRDAVHGTATSEEEAAERLVTAYERMLPATQRLVAGHFRKLVVAAARERLAQELDPVRPEGGP